jgi:hypothetical protein
LVREENLYLTGKVLAARAAGRRLCVDPGTATEEAGGNDTCIVQDHELVSAEELREIQKNAVVQAARGPRQPKHTGSIATLEGLLSDLVRGKVIIEVFQEHQWAV